MIIKKIFINQNGDKKTLEDYPAKNGYVLFFYPKANSPICSLQARSYKTYYLKIKSFGYQVFGISNDKPDKNKKFHQRLKLPYDLISDIDHEFANNFDFKYHTIFNKILISRDVFVADKKGNNIFGGNKIGIIKKNSPLLKFLAEKCISNDKK